jgi:hypothetical protein
MCAFVKFETLCVCTQSKGIALILCSVFTISTVEFTPLPLLHQALEMLYPTPTEEWCLFRGECTQKEESLGKCMSGLDFQGFLSSFLVDLDKLLNSIYL